MNRLRNVVPVLLVLALFALMVSCDSEPTDPTLAPESPAGEISDGAHGENGNQYFYLLPPLVEQPTITGTFDPELAPRIEICLLETRTTSDGTTTAQCVAGDPAGEFGSSEITAEADHYHVNWQTDVYPVADIGSTYRITFFLGELYLGFADVQMLENGKGKRNVDDETFALVDGRTLPLRFHVSEGAFCGSQTDCVETSVPHTGDVTVTTSTKDAGAYFSPGWFDPDVVGTTEVKVTIYRRDIAPGEPCHEGYLLPNWEGCYVFETEPWATPIKANVIVGVCLDPEAEEDPRHQDGQLAALHRDGSFELLDNVPALDGAGAPFLTCDDFLAYDGSRGGLERLAGRGLELLTSPVRWAFATPLHATHNGDGGLIAPGSVGFSDIGWVWPIQLRVYQDLYPPTSVSAGSQIEVPLEFYSIHGGTEHLPPPEEVATVPLFVTYEDPTGPVLDHDDITAMYTHPSDPYVWNLSTEPGTHTLTFDGGVLHPLVLQVEVAAQSDLQMDGVSSAGEWDAANCQSFDVQYYGIEGVETAVDGASFCIYERSEGVYVKLEANLSRIDVTALVQFDADGDYAGENLVPDPGDDVVILPGSDFANIDYDGYYGGEGAVIGCTGENLVCLYGDTEVLYGESDQARYGTVDGYGGWTMDGTAPVVFEFFHPFGTNDAALDMQVGQFDTIHLQGRFNIDEYWSYGPVYIATRPAEPSV